MEEKESKTIKKRGRLSRLLNGENIKEDHSNKKPSNNEGNICDNHIDGA